MNIRHLIFGLRWGRPNVFLHRENAFSLVEVTLALGIAAFAFVIILALLPTALNSNRETLRQTAAAGLATLLISDLRSTAATSTTSALYGLSLPGTTAPPLYLNEDGSISPTATGNGRDPVYRATVVVTSPSPTFPRGASTAWVRITWPANSATPFGTFETVVGLDRN